MAIGNGTHQPLGELLVDRGLLTRAELELGLADAGRTQRPLGATLVALGFVTEPTIARALATQNGGIAKSEYGVAIGYDSAIPVSANAEAPPVSVKAPARRTQPAPPPLPPDVTLPPAAGAATELEDRLDDMARQLAAAALRVVAAERARDAALERADETTARVAELEQLASDRAAPAAEPASHQLFFAGGEGYALEARNGPPPAPGSSVEVAGRSYVVARVGPSPGDPSTACAFLL